jgi:hypothetical protein
MVKRSRTQVDGLYVVDAKRPVQFEVFDRDVKVAAKDRHSCPISWALTRRLGAKMASVTRGVVLVQMNGSRVYRRYRPCGETREALIEFDRTGKFTPGKFEIVPFSHSLRLGRAHGHTGQSSRAKPERLAHHRFESPVYRAPTKGEK